MANGFTVNALLNASKWIRGTKDMEGALDDLEGSLDDAANEVRDLDRDAERAFDSIGDAAKDAAEEVKDIGTDGKKALDKLEKAADDAADGASDLEKKLRKVRDEVKDVGDDSKKGFDRAKEGVEEFGDEANSTAKEAAASFDGSVESIGDAFQELAANAFAGFGPAGAVAGIAAAAGLGTVFAAFEQINAEQEASRQRISEWAEAFIEAGGQVVGAAQVAAEIQDIATDGARYDEAKRNAKTWGVDVSTAMLAMAGDATALAVVQDNLTTNSETLGAALDAVGGDMRGLTKDQRSAWTLTQEGTESFNKLTSEMDEGAATALTVSDSLKKLVNSAGTATLEVDELGNSLYTLPDETQVMVNAKTGIATQNIAAFKGDLDGVPETVNTTAKVWVDDYALRNYRPPVLWVESRVLAPRDGRQIY